MITIPCPISFEGGEFSTKSCQVSYTIVNPCFTPHSRAIRQSLIAPLRREPSCFLIHLSAVPCLSAWALPLYTTATVFPTSSSHFPRCPLPIQSIDAVRSPPGVLICGIPTCLRAFLSKPELLLHVHESHQDLFKPATPAPPQQGANPPQAQHRPPFQPRADVEHPPFFRGPAPGGPGPGRMPGQMMPSEGFRLPR